MPEPFVQDRPGQVRPDQPRPVLDVQINAKFYAFIVFLLFAFSYFVYYNARQRALCSSRPSSSGPCLHSNDPSTQILVFNTKDDHFSYNAYVESGRWQCDHSYGSIILQRVVPVSLTVLSDSFIDCRTVVCRCRVAIYRPRRKKGRIKCDAEKRHSFVGEQKIDKIAGDVLRFDLDGDKNTLSTPSVTNGLRSTRDSPLPHSATVAQIPLPDESDTAVAGQSERRTLQHDTLVTTSRAPYLGTTGRFGSWINRSPTHSQRESTNAKFLCQWHERVVIFCSGLFTLIMLIRLTTKLTTLISLGNETHFIETFSLIYRPFPFSFFPCPKQANPTLPRRSRLTIARKLVKTNNRTKGRPHYLGHQRCFKELPAQIAPGQGHIVITARDGKILRWFDPTNDHRFSGEHISIFETFLGSF